MSTIEPPRPVARVADVNNPVTTRRNPQGTFDASLKIGGTALGAVGVGLVIEAFGRTAGVLALAVLQGLAIVACTCSYGRSRTDRHRQDQKAPRIGGTTRSFGESDGDEGRAAEGAHRQRREER